ncbi:phospholipase A and acyltransferase 5-like [Tubulanus polymorphus]|uniref:phospholipase A and acyltransferase 5-like n=1 Tax=Tubulanus polymorphus TaxID=672921 RepID=UPI003DA58442
MEANNYNNNNQSSRRCHGDTRLSSPSTPPSRRAWRPEDVVARGGANPQRGGSPILMSPLGNFIRASDLQAEPGDLIEINRTIYCHWALYVGDGKAIHITGENSEISQENVACRLDDLVDIAGASRVRVNNREVPAKERGLVALPVDEIITRARSQLGENLEYNLLTRNCEHYVTEWRYGVGWSDQADIALGVMTMFSQFNRKPDSAASNSTSAHNAMMTGIEALLQQTLQQRSNNSSPRNNSTDHHHHSLLR